MPMSHEEIDKAIEELLKNQPEEVSEHIHGALIAATNMSRINGLGVICNDHDKAFILRRTSPNDVGDDISIQDCISILQGADMVIVNRSDLFLALRMFLEPDEWNGIQGFMGEHKS